MKYLLFAALLLLSGILQAGTNFFNQYPDKIRDAELSGNRELVATLCREWYTSGDYSQSLLFWNYNAMISVDQDAIYLTQNEDDTYPAMLLQYALDIRPDVDIINVNWLQDAAYRARISATFFPEEKAALSIADLYKKWSSPSRKNNLYLGVQTDLTLLGADKSRLFLTGLAFKYTDKSFDNVAVIKNNIENKFALDYLKTDILIERERDKISRLNLNYLPAMITLFQHYQNTGENFKAEKMQNLSLRIAQAGGREAEVRTIFFPPGNDTSFVSAIPPKKLEKPMKKLSAKLYAADVETTNEQYEAFLVDLLKNKEFDLLATCQSAKTDWRALLPDSLKHLQDAALYTHGHPDGPGFPVQNISKQAAEAYCAWITKVYNANAGGKNKFKKVRFRLPTEAEWEIAAAGGIGMAVYPWGGAYVRNNKGCYLGNYWATIPCGDCPQKGDVSEDGGFFPVKSDSYFPNNFGLYCVSGNVAEMVQEDGRAKGGSWSDGPGLCHIKDVKKYTQPSPSIGFRVFMDVIEE